MRGNTNPLMKKRPDTFQWRYIIGKGTIAISYPGNQRSKPAREHYTGKPAFYETATSYTGAAAVFYR